MFFDPKPVNPWHSTEENESGVLYRPWNSCRRDHSIAELRSVLGAWPTLTVLLRRTIRNHLHRSRPEKILTVFQRIHFRFFLACGLASGRASFASSRRQCRSGS